MSTKPSPLCRVGQTHHSFLVTNIVNIPELQCDLYELIHEPSGAQIMHLANEDLNNLFCLSFKTLPKTSNGVAHILEHTVLSGSKKFPVKDPFFSMNRRSLNTFMNALTGADFTCYPAASQIPKDFYHLLEVYLDAVFHPLLNKLSFLQEGHRLEFQDPSNPDTPLEYKGIVYNEMKGALSSPSSRLFETLNAALFPHVTYGCNSGGDPRVIPQLSYEEMKHFHETFYHPSRCLFFFYGNLPLEDHLDFIAKQILDQTKKVPPLAPIPYQPRFKAPVYQEAFYPIAPEEETQEKTMIAFGWLTCNILQQQDILALNILDIILMDNDASPLKFALLQSGLCKQAQSFIDVEINEIPWGIILKGCQPGDADALEQLIKETLQTLSQSGIPLQSIENAIHQLELHRSEITGNHSPFGLSLFMRSGLLKQHGADPVEGLMIHSLFERLCQHILTDPRYFSDLIQKYLIDNSHYVRIVMRPDPELGKKENEEEQRALATLKASLTEEQKQALIHQAKQLAKFQKQQEDDDLEVLPKITLRDVPISTKNYSLTEEKIGALTVFHHPVFTNNILYTDVIFDLPALSEEDLPYLRLFTVALTQMGSGNRSYQENLEYMQAHTGGIGASINLHLNIQHPSHFSPSLHLKGKAMYRKKDKLFSLLHDTIVSADLTDFRRFKEILIKHFTSLESRLTSSALKYAINLSASPLNVACKVVDDLYGLNYYWKISELVKNLDQQGPAILEKLQEIQQKVMGLDHPHLVLSCDRLLYDELKAHGFYGLKDLKTKPFQPWTGNFPLVPIPAQGRMIASPVSFIAKVFPTIPYTHPHSPALNIAAPLFDNLVLHSKIREQGGAYGGGAANTRLAGYFYFYSYRDPQIVSTFRAFEEAVRVVIDGEFKESDVEEALFEMVQELDAPDAPGSRGDIAYSWRREGRTQEIRQAYRNKLLALTREEIIEATRQIIAPEMKKGTVVVFAGEELLKKANQELENEGNPPLSILGI